jgi:hypothetical protein
MAIKIQHSIRTLRLKVKAEGYAWLNKAAIEVNDVWNFANATSYKAARPRATVAKLNLSDLRDESGPRDSSWCFSMRLAFVWN